MTRLSAIGWAALLLLAICPALAAPGTAAKPLKAAASASSADAPAAPNPTCPQSIRTYTLTPWDILRTLPKDRAYTEGLAFREGYLYESRGLEGRSALVRIEARSGATETLKTLDPKTFAEGIAFHGNRLFQLTYRANSVLRYDLRQDLQALGALSYPDAMWGLATAGDSLVLSDGTDTLRLLDPDTFAVRRRIPVTPPLWNLNELEVVGDTVLANIYNAEVPAIVGIELATGCVTTVIDLKGILAAYPELTERNGAVCDGKCTIADFVANGIAYDPGADELYLTGKNWPYLFVVKNPLSGP